MTPEPKFHIYTRGQIERGDEQHPTVHRISDYVVTIEDDESGYRDSISVMGWAIFLEFRIKCAKKKLLRKYLVVRKHSTASS